MFNLFSRRAPAPATSTYADPQRSPKPVAKGKESPVQAPMIEIASAQSPPHPQRKPATQAQPAAVQAPKPLPPEPEATVFAADVSLSLSGRLDSKGTVLVKGAVTGDISCKTLIVSEGGSLSGHVVAETMSLQGSFDGEARVADLVIAPGASIKGVAVCRSFNVKGGATIDAQIRCDKAMALAEAVPANFPHPRNALALQPPVLDGSTFDLTERTRIAV